MSDVLDFNLDNIQDITLLPESEQRVTIKKAEIKESQQGNTYINLRLGVEDQPLASEIYHIVMVPTTKVQEEDPRKAALYKQQYVNFLKAFRLEHPLNLDACVGATSWALVGVGKDQNDIDKNVIRRFVAPA